MRDGVHECWIRGAAFCAIGSLRYAEANRPSRKESSLRSYFWRREIQPGHGTAAGDLKFEIRKFQRTTTSSSRKIFAAVRTIVALFPIGGLRPYCCNARIGIVSGLEDSDVVNMWHCPSKIPPDSITRHGAWISPVTTPLAWNFNAPFSRI